MSARNTGGSKSAKNSQGRAPGGGGFTKSGKPRPGTGGYGKGRLEGKGPTPPAEMRPGHPAQRAAARAAKAAAAGKPAAVGKAAAVGKPASRAPSVVVPRARLEQSSPDRRPERRERRDDVARDGRGP